MFCTKCGRSLPDDAKFCTGCGAAVGDEPEEIPASKETQIQTDVQTDAQTNVQADVRKDAVAKTSKKSYTLVCSIVGVLIAAAVGICIFMVLDGKGIIKKAAQGKPETDMEESVAEASQENTSEETTELAAVEPTAEEGSEETAANQAVTETTPDTAEDAAEELPEEEAVVFEPWDIDIGSEINYIESWCKETDQNLDNYTYYDFGDFSCYAIHGTPVKVIVKKGYNGWDYNREYYGTSIFYVHTYNVGEDHKFYFSDLRLMRYLDENGIVHDYGEENWADIVSLSERAEKEQKELYDYITKNIN